MNVYFLFTKKSLFLILTFLSICLPTSAQRSDESKLEKARESHAYAIGALAYQYGSLLLEAEKKWYKSADKRGVNKLVHIRSLGVPGRGSAHNRDTLYSGAALDLSDEPLSLVVPDAGERYLSVQIVDSFGETTIIRKGRSNGLGPGEYTLVGPGWAGARPSGTTLLKFSGIRARLLVRAFVYDENDLDNARKIQDQFQLSAERPSEMDIETEPSVRFAADFENDPLSFYEELNRRLTEDPPPPTDSSLMIMLAQYGIGSNLSFDRKALDPASIKGLTQAIEQGPELSGAAKEISSKQTRIGDWNAINADSESLRNAAINRATRPLTWGLDTEEVVYMSSAMPLTGARNYTLRFEPNRFPPVEVFWSLTVYKEGGGLAENPINRYSIGDRSGHLKFEADGSLKIRLQNESPGAESESNWLPIPSGGFRLSLRCYGPGPELLNGDYVPPSIMEAL